jgi:hypothetical protein
MGHWISIAARPQHIITKLKNNCCKQAISPTITKIDIVGEIAMLQQQLWNNGAIMAVNGLGVHCHLPFSDYFVFALGVHCAADGADSRAATRLLVYA